MSGTGTRNGTGRHARVRTQDGWAVRDAVVTVTDTAGAQVLRAETDAEGGVRTDTALPAGPCTVIVTAPGHAPHPSTALVAASGRAEVGAVVPARQGGGEPPPAGV